MPNDDIRGATPVPDPSPPPPRHRSVGPESEDRGGSEAPDHTLAEDPISGQQEPNRSARVPDGMPGERAALPEGTLPNPYLGAQGDENREPPRNAPSQVEPTVTVPPSRQAAGRAG